MVKLLQGLVADHNVETHVELLASILEGEPFEEMWSFLALDVESFETIGLRPDAPDRQVWEVCQDRRLMLVTANRRQEREDSLENTIRLLNQTDSVPVVTLADAVRLLKRKPYARRVAERLLEHLFDIEYYLGAGRLYLP